MWLVKLSIERPVFISMVVFATLVFGLLSFFRIGVDEFPAIDPPVITVTTEYQGAGPREIETLISKPLEEEISQLGGIERLVSTSREGISQVVVEFKLGIDARVSQAEVRDKVSRVIPKFPEGAEDPLIQRLDFSDRPILQLALKSSQKDMSEADLWLLADNAVKPKLQQVNGVGQVNIYGGLEREIAVELNRQALSLWKISPTQVGEALKAANLNTPAGTLSESPSERALRVVGEFQNVAEIENVVVKTLPGNRTVLIKDVASIRDNFEDQSSIARLNGKPIVLLEVKKQSDASTVEVAKTVLDRLDEINSRLPAGTQVEFVFDGARRIRNTVNDVIETLIIAAILAIVVVYFFLGSVQSTFVTGLALPMTVIASFSALYFLGFTLNVMTLLGLTLAVGLILDDAIVVRENIWTKIEEGVPPKEAALEGTREVFVAVLATSATILSVFLPVTLIPGIVGKFFSAFALTVCISIIFSTFDALTMAPMMSAHLISEQGKHAPSNRALLIFERYWSALAAFYGRCLAWALGHRRKVLLGAAALFVVSVILPKFIGFTFLPQTERGEIQLSLEAPAGTALDHTNELVAIVEKKLAEFSEVSLISSRVGSELNEKNIASIYIKLVPDGQRSRKTGDMKMVIRESLTELGKKESLIISVGDPGSNRGGGKQISVAIQGTNTDTLSEISQQVLKEAREKIPSIAELDSSMKHGQQEIQFSIRRERLSAFGLSSVEVGKFLRYFFDGVVTTQFRESDREFDIRVRLRPEERLGISTLASIQIPNQRGEMIPLSAITSMDPGTAPTKITRIDRSRSVLLEGDMKPGQPLGAAIADLRKVIEAKLPAGYTADFQGQAKNLKDLGVGFVIAMSLAVLFIYMVMASLYESLILPFSILLTLPLAIIGAFSALMVTGKFLDVYTIIGVIMLMGLVTKNAILLVDYLEQLREGGMERQQAIYQAGMRRLRPIMMTSFAMIAGFLPVAFGFGEVNQERSGMGVAAIGGLTSSTILSLIVVPCAYTYLDDLRVWSSRKVRKLFGKKDSGTLAGKVHVETSGELHQ